MINTALYSFWSKPYLANKGFKKFGEFNNKSDFILSWSTSVKLSKLYFNEVILVTDNWSWKNIFKKLKLPFDNILTKLDDIIISEKLWSISKAYAIKYMENPFIHIDSDVFIWKKLKDDFLKADILVQNEEGIKDKNQYLLYIGLEWDYINYLNGTCEYLNNFNAKDRDVSAYNCGIIGGNNIDFLKKYADEMINLSVEYSLKDKYINCYTTAWLEQALLYSMCEKHNIDVKLLINDLTMEQNFYTHLAGQTKRNPLLIKKLKNKYNILFEKNVSIN